jgi:hypothetical protein
MALKVRPGVWSCAECGKLYPDSAKADACRSSHSLIYVGFTKEDLNRLLNFIYLKEEALITEDLVKKISSALRRQI